MKSLIVGLLAVSMLAGCGSIVGKETPITLDDGSRGFTMMRSYGPFLGTRGQALQVLQSRSNSRCDNGFIRLSEKEIDQVKPSGEIRYDIREIIWEIKCKSSEQPAS